ncbi:MAG: hypothetical protein ACFFBD_26810, partial [Candidatus Hodarchaeota archaeon]
MKKNKSKNLTVLELNRFLSSKPVQQVMVSKYEKSSKPFRDSLGDKLPSTDLLLRVERNSLIIAGDTSKELPYFQNWKFRNTELWTLDRNRREIESLFANLRNHIGRQINFPFADGGTKFIGSRYS